MNWKGTATLGVVGGLLVTLLATASPSIVRQRDARPPAAAIDVQQGEALRVETARLNGRLHPPSPPLPSTRNPFAFGRAAAASSSRRSAPDVPLVPLPAPDTIRTPPPFTLVGLAEDRTATATVKTAILSSPGALQFVKEGDSVEGGYRVAAINSESVELLADDGRLLLLRLK